MNANRKKFDGAEFELEQFVQELHDGPLQLMVGAKMLCESTSRSAEDSAATNLRLKTLLERAITETRSLLHRFGPPDLAETDWISALRRWLALILDEDSPVVDLRIDPKSASLPAAAELVAYRVSQEAIYNALRHGRAKRIILEAGRHAGVVRISITDNGCGFDTQQIPADRRGVYGMRQRVTAIGGEFEIASQPAGGTKVVAAFPCESSEKAGD